MNLNDFRCMRRGVHVSVLKPEDTTLLKAIDRRNGRKQRALLLIHGFSSSPAVFRHFLPAFSDCYDAIVAPVLPAHAIDLDVFATMKVSELLQHVTQICDDLTREYEEVDVMGLSLGGILACQLGRIFHLNHLYLLAPALDLHLATNKIIKLAKFLRWLGFYRVRNEAGNIYASNDCEIAYQQLPLTTIIALLNFIEQFKFTTPSCSTDLFLGKYDDVVASQAVAARFANTDNTTIHWLDNSAHILPLDGNIEAIVACVKNNLKNNHKLKSEA